jgi:beta-glucosidase
MVISILKIYVKWGRLKMSEKYQFPFGFDWGVGCASFQIEGSCGADGKGESIWDRFSHVPGNIYDNSAADTACDFYNLYEKDILIAKELGIKTFRFSVSWPRIFPDGTGAVNEAGISFYRKVLACIHENGIRAAVTMYNWDLPQKLQDRGGWANREIVGWFEAYAKLLYERLGDLVDVWVTLNEPYYISLFGYWMGEHAPGFRDYTTALTAAHNLLMSHGSAVKAYRKTGLKGDMGITLNMYMSYPFDPGCPADVEAANRNQLQVNNLFGDPIFLGKYPEELFSFLKRKNIKLPEIKDEDLELISQKLDFFGVNTYFTDHVQADKTAWPLEVRTLKTGKPCTTAGWEINPEGIYDLLKWINDRYKPQKLLIAENGTASNDLVDIEGRVSDPNRINYLHRYLIHVHKAIQEGIPVEGYYVWCFTDNFEWAWGLSRRFGIIYVDYQTQKRIPKESAYWYSGVIKNNGI